MLIIRAPEGCRRLSRWAAATVLAIVTCAGAEAAPQRAQSDAVIVVVDHAKVVRLPEKAQTVVVGNPAIADVTMQDANTAFITGKGFGTTNVIAMDADGRQIASFRVVVTSSADRSVTLIKGREQITLSCAPRCEQTASSGSNAAP